MEATKDTILIIEDNAGQNELLSEKVQNCGYETYSVYSAVQAFEWLEANKAILMLLDFSLPDLNGKEFIVWLKSENVPVPPFVVATGQGDERIAVEMMKLGARDYVVKDSNFLEMISLVVCKAINEIQNEYKLKSVENELAESNQFNKQIIQSAQEGLVVYDLDLKYLVWNPFMEKITGIQSKDVLGKYVLDVFPFLKDTEMSENLKLALKGEQCTEIEFNFSIPETGKTGWVSESIATLQNAEMQIIGVIATIHDITERKKTEQELIGTKDWLHKLLSTSTELIDSKTMDYERITEIARELSGAKYVCFNIFDENGRDFTSVAFSGLSDFQQKTLDLFEFEIINKKWSYDPIREARLKDNTITEFDSLESLAHDFLPKFVFNRIKKSIKFGKIAVVKVAKNNKNVGDFTLLMKEGVDIKNPEILELFANQVGLFVERQLSEEKLRKNEEKFRILFADNPQPMFVYDLETLEILEVNQTALGLYGYTKEESMSMTIKNLHPVDELPTFLKSIEQTLAGINTDGVSHHIKKNGEKIIVEVFTVPATSIGPNARHVLVVDITERKLAEEALTQKMDELMRFHQLTVGREHSMIELKREINHLLVKFGEMEKYKIVE